MPPGLDASRGSGPPASPGYLPGEPHTVGGIEPGVSPLWWSVIGWGARGREADFRRVHSNAAVAQARRRAPRRMFLFAPSHGRNLAIARNSVVYEVVPPRYGRTASNGIRKSVTAIWAPATRAGRVEFEGTHRFAVPGTGRRVCPAPLGGRTVAGRGAGGLPVARAGPFPGARVVGRAHRRPAPGPRSRLGRWLGGDETFASPEGSVTRSSGERSHPAWLHALRLDGPRDLRSDSSRHLCASERRPLASPGPMAQFVVWAHRAIDPASCTRLRVLGVGEGLDLADAVPAEKVSGSVAAGDEGEEVLGQEVLGDGDVGRGGGQGRSTWVLEEGKGLPDGRAWQERRARASILLNRGGAWALTHYRRYRFRRPRRVAP